MAATNGNGNGHHHGKSGSAAAAVTQVEQYNPYRVRPQQEAPEEEETGGASAAADDAPAAGAAAAAQARRNALFGGPAAGATTAFGGASSDETRPAVEAKSGERKRWARLVVALGILLLVGFVVAVAFVVIRSRNRAVQFDAARAQQAAGGGGVKRAGVAGSGSSAADKKAIDGSEEAAPVGVQGQVIKDAQKIYVQSNPPTQQPTTTGGASPAGSTAAATTPSTTATTAKQVAGIGGGADPSFTQMDVPALGNGGGVAEAIGSRQGGSTDTAEGRVRTSGVDRTNSSSSSTASNGRSATYGGGDYRTEGGSTGAAYETSSSASSSSAQTRSRRSAERSIHLTEPAKPLTNVASSTARSDAASASNNHHPRAFAANKSGASRVTPQGVVIPNFGQMLPVRTLGSFFTLRSGSLARLELTRDVRGDGWELRRGTVLVGVGRGGEYDRAYVAIVGFIDPASGRLVRMTGDVLGSDGGSGLKGKRHKLSGGWSKALGRIGGSAVNVMGLMASGFGRSSTVAADAYGYRIVNPVADEMSGLAREMTERRDSKGFVEVAAGAAGYVLVTDLPKEIDGIDAVAELDREELSQSADTTRRRASTGLSEQELADLLSTGTPDEIREAMPRMTPEMRRVAQSVINEAEN